MAIQFDTNGNLLMGGGGIYGAGTMEIPADTIKNADVRPTAAIAASKSEQSYSKTVNQPGTAVTRRYTIAWCQGAAGLLRKFAVACQTACSGSSTVTVDLQVGGVSVLTAVITISSATSTDTELLGTITDGTLADGDRVDVVITTVLSGTDAFCENIMAQVQWDEDYAA